MDREQLVKDLNDWENNVLRFYDEAGERAATLPMLQAVDKIIADAFNSFTIID